jgi:hypothetical protein
MNVIFKGIAISETYYALALMGHRLKFISIEKSIFRP